MISINDPFYHDRIILITDYILIQDSYFAEDKVIISLLKVNSERFFLFSKQL